VGLFGVRLGATLAMSAAARRADVECLIAWGPVVSGRAHERELRAFRITRGRRASTPPPFDGGEEVRGYSFSRETLADIAAMDLLAGDGCPARRVLLLSRGDRATGEEAQLARHLTEQGAEVRLAPPTGYARMMRDDPYESVVPFHALDSVVDWVGEGRFPEIRASAPTTGIPNDIVLVSADGKRAQRETPIVFGDGGRLFGILSDPDGAARADRPVLCLLNAGATPHVGPHRMYVELARHLAQCGYRTFRFDVAGLGESRAPTGSSENRLYARESVADVKSAMTMLARERGADRFVVVGLCAGAYLAYRAAVEDPRVTGQILISPFAFERNEGDSVAPAALRQVVSNRSYARALLDYRIWLRALRGEVDATRAAKILRQRVQAHARTKLSALAARVRGEAERGTDVERTFQAMCDRGAASLLVLGFDDGGLDMIARYLGHDARRMRGRKNFSLEIVEGADHTFGAAASKQKLFELITRYLVAHFA
jgi:pimeloyl-ACP methyl ester carboxylesterase